MSKYWIVGQQKEEIFVDLEEFEKTDLERDLDRTFGRRERTVYDNIVSTYEKHMWLNGNTNITVVTDEVPEQIYKSANLEIKIKVNKEAPRT